MVTLGTIVRHTGALCSPRAVLSGRAFPLPWIQHLPSIYRGKSSAGATRTQITRGTSTRGFASSTAPHAASARDQQDVFDFETHIDRANTGSLKWDRYKGKDVIPLWVADMDLKTAPAIVAAVHDRLDHGIFGYTSPTEGAQEAVMKYYKERHGVEVPDKSWLLFTPGTVQSMNAACSMLPDNASVMVITPSYPPFFQSPKHTNRGLVTVPADRAGGRWTFDWEAMETAMQENPEVALFMLCNPYNPVGRVFTAEELVRVGEFCVRHDLIIVSDEIHCDLILDEELTHISMLALEGGRFADRTILLNAPSKTYNVPGLGCSYAIIPDKALRLGFAKASRGWITQNSPLGYVGCEAAYNEGDPWRQALLEHLRGNRAALYAFMEERLPELRMDPMEATYLAWVDVTALGWKSPGPEFERAGVGLTDGKTFLGEGYVRINFACPRATLMEGLRRMEHAVISGYREKDRPSLPSQ
eukprot:jgi/Undpi1/13804/HiC_scaffold_9.g03455.m1